MPSLRGRASKSGDREISKEKKAFWQGSDTFVATDNHPIWSAAQLTDWGENGPSPSKLFPPSIGVLDAHQYDIVTKTGNFSAGSLYVRVLVFSRTQNVSLAHRRKKPGLMKGQVDSV